MRVSRMSLALSAISITALVGATEAKTPSLDFLEYLGRMVEHEGQWVDPLDMEDGLFADRDEPSPPLPVNHEQGVEPSPVDGGVRRRR